MCLKGYIDALKSTSLYEVELFLQKKQALSLTQTQEIYLFKGFS